MTTGRINQVTILRVRSHALQGRSRLVTPHPRRGDQDIYKVGGGPEPNAQPGGPPGPKPHEGPLGHPIAPTELPKGRSGADVGFATLNAGPHCTIRPSAGG